jgi:hypothetical protein
VRNGRWVANLGWAAGEAGVQYVAAINDEAARPGPEGDCDCDEG